MPARCAALRAACSFRKKINSSSSKFEAQITSVPLITNRMQKITAIGAVVAELKIYPVLKNFFGTRSVSRIGLLLGI
ncbi:hypothetical protein J6590_021228 [Homalodisca vitripennis]|nr:hypothetical protein J6590_021228 [Homalodisca vitripennis]